MNKDRLAAALRVRELVEQRRLVEAAAAERRLAEAGQVRGETELACREAGPREGRRGGAEEIARDRLGALALQEAAERAAEEERLAEREAELAARRRAEAGVERRSVERLRERRAARTALELARRTERHLDEAGVQLWRRQT